MNIHWQDGERILQLQSGEYVIAHGHYDDRLGETEWSYYDKDGKTRYTVERGHKPKYYNTLDEAQTQLAQFRASRKPEAHVHGRNIVTTVF